MYLSTSTKYKYQVQVLYLTPTLLQAANIQGARGKTMRSVLRARNDKQPTSTLWPHLYSNECNLVACIVFLLDVYSILCGHRLFVCLFDVKSLDKARQLLLGNYHRYLV